MVYLCLVLCKSDKDDAVHAVSVVPALEPAADGRERDDCGALGGIAVDPRRDPADGNGADVAPPADSVEYVHIAAVQSLPVLPDRSNGVDDICATVRSAAPVKKKNKHLLGRLYPFVTLTWPVGQRPFGPFGIWRHSSRSWGPAAL